MVVDLYLSMEKMIIKQYHQLNHVQIVYYFLQPAQKMLTTWKKLQLVQGMKKKIVVYNL